MFAQRAAARAAKPVAAARSLATVSSLGKRTTLANVQSDSSTSSLTLVLKAGSRFEPAQGAAAVLKNSAFKSNAASSALAIARGTEQLGGALSATLTREHLLLTADFLPGDEEFFLKTLHAALFPKFLAHEHNEQVKPLVAQETQAAVRSPAVSALEISHRIAFRKGLGNSLFASADEPVAFADVQTFFRSAFSQEIGLIGQGIDTATLEGHAGDLFGEELDIQLENRKVPFNSKQAVEKTSYYGGEERVAIDLHLLPEAKPTLVVSYGLTKAASADSLVLPHLLGSAPSIKWSAGSSPLGQAAAATEGSTASALLSSYSDAQLLSIEVQAEGSKRLSETGKAVVAAIQELASGKLSDEQVKGAVARAKYEAAANAEYTSSVAHTVANQLLTGKSASLADTFKALDAVTPESLTKALKEFIEVKPTVVSIARLGQMAYADELGLKM